MCRLSDEWRDLQRRTEDCYQRLKELLATERPPATADRVAEIERESDSVRTRQYQIIDRQQELEQQIIARIQQSS